MTTPSVVILTEPANCEGVDAQLLLQAVLQMQHLGEEGVPVSQAFCDNPAAADGFVDAYAKAYPGLVPQSPDLPPPEQLYSMIADGRLAPLPGLNPAPIAPHDAAMLQSLVVLSLGKPDALMQALEGQHSVRNRVKVIEIAPQTEEQIAPVTVAAAVAGHLIGATTSSGVTTSPEYRQPQDDAPSGPEEGSNAPLKLETVESNLDRVESDANGEQVHHGGPTMGIAGTMPVSPADNAGPAAPAHADASTTGSGGDTGLISPSDSQGASAASAPMPTVATAAGPTTAPAPDPAVAPAPIPTAVIETRGSASGDISPEGAQGADASAEVPEGSNRNPTDPHASETDGSGSDDTAPNAVQPSHEPNENLADANRIAADPNVTDTKEEEVVDGRSSFSEPGEDVVYAPTGSFTPEDDMSYPLPAAALEADSLGGVLRLSMADDTIDLEAIYSSGAADAPEETEPFDPILTRAPGSDACGDVYSPQTDDVGLGHLDLPGSEPDTHQDKTPAPVHDLDI